MFWLFLSSVSVSDHVPALGTEVQPPDLPTAVDEDCNSDRHVFFIM